MAVRLEHPSVSSARGLVQPKGPILLLEQEQREHIDGKLTLLARRSIWLPQLDIDTPTRLFMSADDFFPASYRKRLIDNLFLIKTCDDLDRILQALRERLCDEPTQHLPYRLCGACDGDVNGHRHIRATLMHLTLTRGRIAVTLWVCRRLNVDF